MFLEMEMYLLNKIEIDMCQRGEKDGVKSQGLKSAKLFL